MSGDASPRDVSSREETDHVSVSGDSGDESPHRGTTLSTRRTETDFSDIRSCLLRLADDIASIKEILNALLSEARAKRTRDSDDSQPGPSPGPPPVSAEAAAKAARLALLDEVFPNACFQRAVSVNVPNFVSLEYAKKDQNGHTGIITFSMMIVRVLLFSVRNTDCRAVRKTADGLKHDTLRTQVIRNLIFNLNLRLTREVPSHGQHRRPPHPAEGGGSCRTSQTSQDLFPSAVLLREPRAVWLTPGFFKNKHFVSLSSDSAPASGAAATPPSKKRKLPASPEYERDKVAFTIIKDLRERLTTFLNRSRHYARTKFATDIGFILMGDAKGASLTLLDGSENHDDETRLVEEYKCVSDSCVAAAQQENTQILDLENDALYADLVTLGTKHCMFYLATYDVSVQTVPGVLEMRTLTRRIHLVDVAIDFCLTFFHSPHRANFLRSSKDSLRLILLLAIAFREIVRSVPIGSLDRGRVAGGEQSPSVLLKSLIPGIKYYTSTILPRVTAMTLDTYVKLNESPPAVDAFGVKPERQGGLVADPELGLIEIEI